MLVFKKSCYKFQQSVNIQAEEPYSVQRQLGQSYQQTPHFFSEGVRTAHVRRLSPFAEGKVNSEIVNNVTSVICRSDVMIERLRLKDHLENPVHVRLSEM